MLNSYLCNTFILTEWRITALGVKEVWTVKVTFQIMWFIKETEKIPGKIHKEHQFLSFTSTILGEKRKSDSQIQKRFSADKVILVNHCSCWIGFWYGYEQEIVTSKAWMMKENPQILSISANLYAIHYFYKENWVPHFFTQGSFQFKPWL